jgi:arsenate reductase
MHLTLPKLNWRMSAFVLLVAILIGYQHFAQPNTLTSPTRETTMTDSTRPKRVLFVCVENSCRSQLAQALVKMRGEGKIEAYSAGSRPSGIVNPKAIASMRELGYDLSKHASKGLADVPDVEFDAAITMGCGDACPRVRALIHEDWGIPDPKDLDAEEFRKVCEMIDTKVKDLLQRLCVE